MFQSNFVYIHANSPELSTTIILWNLSFSKELANNQLLMRRVAFQQIITLVPTSYAGKKRKECNPLVLQEGIFQNVSIWENPYIVSGEMVFAGSHVGWSMGVNIVLYLGWRQWIHSENVDSVCTNLDKMSLNNLTKRVLDII